MHSLVPHHTNPQIQQFLQLQQATASAIATPNPLNVGGANNLNSQLHGSASNLHGLPMGGDPWGTGIGTQLSLPMQHQHKLEEEKIYFLITELTNPANREQALVELSKKREQYDDLALILWHSFGVMAALLQEIVSVYPLLVPPQLTGQISNRVCNALALLQCVASHSETRGLFLNAHIPLFLYPFLNTTSKTRPFEYLRLTSLGVIGALVKNDNPEVISFLLSTEIIPLCLRIMETGSELSKTVAIFIVQKILLDEMGLEYICATYERFYAVGTVLSNMVIQLVETQAVRLLKHVVRCYLRLSDNPRAREALRQCLPEPLRDATFSQVLKDDMVTKRYLAQLLYNLSDNVVTTN
ncbi:1157_t:CDS:2 [Funneliformis geosporum]|uniref:1382_t:CDS:1 n=1 Tax=Funneliformis geosporum TaxID=1117311 RepID=A0A9W4WNU9_9GLOM|nr:1382_t:CDS:2 [Funneliformis geosporum]CAI2177504.1 1157_t:CDS:2 [Funneliformis geosporum]